MGFLAWILLGLIAGVIAKMIMPGKDPGGFFITILLGIAGSFVGGWVGSLIGLGTVGTLSFGSLITAIVGALILLAAYRFVKK
ncbi:GlsB/YeaQ/YmgE family stress response membrane protein [Halomonas sp. TBZ9]|uniref:GlsB/YeaQ/YmgE family stress response membrane protein n=1 Tax=Vreelandella azerica TaxID=2732867 RepID=A0A7Y3TWU0_9GAMM|nr:GlsB/YeaQ/YmgE family stress response membrane protein [Halomonas azerica]NOG30862.1 GlsB/YeaQ/YmgE family stress response membrane protein [Halomonas azerica]